MTPDLAITIGGSFVAGLATSIHCVGMCGPLACMACKGKGACESAPSAASYHGSRLASYMIAGLIAGLIGGSIAKILPQQLLIAIPWIAGVLLLAWAVGWSFNLFPNSLKRMPRFRPRPEVIGFLTPLIPCAPLYLMLGLCALSGSAAQGAMLALAFGVGTVPLLWFAQANFAWIRQKIGARRFDFLQRGVVIAAALIVLWRLSATTIAGTPTCCEISAAAS